MEKYITSRPGFIGETKQALDCVLKDLKELNTPDDRIAEILQKIDSLYGLLISNLDSIDRFYTFKLWEQKISNEGYFNKIDNELRLHCFGDQDQQSLQACCFSLHRCLSSLSWYLSSLDLLLGRIKDPEDESYLLEDQAPPRPRSRSVGDLLGNCDSGAASVGPRAGRAFSEPLLDLSGWNSKKFIDSDYYAFFRAMWLAKEHIVNIKDQYEINLLLLTLKRVTKFLCDTVDVFQKIVIQKINQESKLYSPAWFFRNAEGISCLCRARELEGILQAVTQQVEVLRDAQADMLAHVQRQAVAESRAVTFLVNARNHNVGARYIHSDNAVQQVRDEKPASPQEKKFCEAFFGETVFKTVKAFILEMMEEGDNNNALAIKFKNNSIEILLKKTEKTDLTIIMPLPNSAQNFFASFDMANFGDSTNARATLPLPKPRKSKLAQFFTSRNKPRTVSNARGLATQQTPLDNKNKTL